MAASSSTHETVRCLCGIEDVVVVSYTRTIDNLSPEVASVVGPPGWTSHKLGGKTIWRCEACTRRIESAKTRSV